MEIDDLAPHRFHRISILLNDMNFEKRHKKVEQGRLWLRTSSFSWDPDRRQRCELRKIAWACDAKNLAQRPGSIFRGKQLYLKRQKATTKTKSGCPATKRDWKIQRTFWHSIFDHLLSNIECQNVREFFNMAKKSKNAPGNAGRGQRVKITRPAKEVAA